MAETHGRTLTIPNISKEKATIVHMVRLILGFGSALLEAFGTLGPENRSHCHDMKILLIEDDLETASYIVRGFTDNGHSVDHRPDARLLSRTKDWLLCDVMIVDRMLPGIDGLSFVKGLRAFGIRTPVLFLTTMGGIDDRIEGLNAGSDDYLIKPFNFFELLARAHALARRPRLVDQHTTIRIADLEVNLLKRSVTRAGKQIALQQKEFMLLEFLMRHIGQVVTRTMLLEGVWDYHFDPRTNIVETHMSRLRTKIDRGYDVQLIHTIRGSGYSIREPIQAV
jgi:two-component system OmpR family response regulator